jgi:hypothetical protein
MGTFGGKRAYQSGAIGTFGGNRGYRQPRSVQEWPSYDPKASRC